MVEKKTKVKEIDFDFTDEKTFNVKGSEVEKEITPYRRFEIGKFDFNKGVNPNTVYSRRANVFSKDQEISKRVAENMAQVSELQNAVEYKLATEGAGPLKRFILRVKHKLPAMKNAYRDYSITELLLAQAQIMDHNVSLLENAINDYKGIIVTLEDYEKKLSSKTLELADYITELVQQKNKLLIELKKHQEKKSEDADLSYREHWALAQKYLIRDLRNIDAEIRKATHYRTTWGKQSNAIDINIKHMQMYSEFSEHIVIMGREASDYLKLTADMYTKSANMGNLGIIVGKRLLAWTDITYKLGEASTKRLHASMALVDSLNRADDNKRSKLESILGSSTIEVENALNEMQAINQATIEDYLKQAENLGYSGEINAPSEIFNDKKDDTKSSVYNRFGIDVDL